MRRAGILLHPTALPGPPGCGSLGAVAHGWIDALADHGIRAWQLLPLAPTDGLGSPYSSPSGFALNPWLLDGAQLVADGLLDGADLETLPQAAAADGFDLPLAAARAQGLAALLLQRYPGWPEVQRQAFGQWRLRQADWLIDHCRFTVLRQQRDGEPWWQWPAPLARRQRSALARLDREQARRCCRRPCCSGNCSGSGRPCWITPAAAACR